MKDPLRWYVENVMGPVFGAKTKTTAELPPLEEHLAQIDRVSAELKAAQPTCRHEWLRPDNGTIECAVCGATRSHYGD